MVTGMGPIANERIMVVGSGLSQTSAEKVGLENPASTLMPAPSLTSLVDSKDIFKVLGLVQW